VELHTETKRTNQSSYLIPKDINKYITSVKKARMTGKRSGSSSRREPSGGAAKKNRRNDRDEEESEQGNGNPMVSSVQDCSDDEEGSDYDQEDSQGGRPNRRGEEVRVRERGAARPNQHGNDEEASLEGSRVDNNDEISTNSTTRTNTPPPTRLPGRNGANIVTDNRNGSIRQQGAPRLLHDIQLDEQNMHNWQLSIREKVRNEIFYMKQFAKEGSEYGSTFQRLLCNKATVPVEVQARYWDSRGRKIARSALNEKRKTIIGAMKSKFLSKFDRDTIICDAEMNTDKTRQLVLVLLYSALQKQLRTERKNICYTTLRY
jgi:hypothetical protein